VDVDVALEPPQPDEVAAVVAQALAVSDSGPDPWWQAGVDEALET
jgi:hypothetical protein